MRSLLWVVTVLIAFGLVSSSSSAENAEHNYVGVKGCKMCHMAPAKGAQYKSWEESKHAKAYETLGTEEAKKIAAEQGIEDPQESAECLKCHVTGYGADASRFEPTYTMEEGVGCESCHGAGKDYKNIKIMKDVEQAKANGLILPTEEVCRKCHNEESPTYKEFDFEARYKEIAHPRPEKE